MIYKLSSVGEYGRGLGYYGVHGLEFLESFMYFWDSIKVGGAGLARAVSQKGVEVFVAGFLLWLVCCHSMLEFSLYVFRGVVRCLCVCLVLCVVVCGCLLIAVEWCNREWLGQRGIMRCILLLKLQIEV